MVFLGGHEKPFEMDMFSPSTKTKATSRIVFLVGVFGGGIPCTMKQASFKSQVSCDTESEVNNWRFRFLEVTGVMATSSVLSTQGLE